MTRFHFLRRGAAVIMALALVLMCAVPAFAEPEETSTTLPGESLLPDNPALDPDTPVSPPDGALPPPDGSLFTDPPETQPPATEAPVMAEDISADGLDEETAELEQAQSVADFARENWLALTAACTAALALLLAVIALARSGRSNKPQRRHKNPYF